MRLLRPLAQDGTRRRRGPHGPLRRAGDEVLPLALADLRNGHNSQKHVQGKLSLLGRTIITWAYRASNARSRQQCYGVLADTHKFVVVMNDANWKGELPPNTVHFDTEASMHVYSARQQGEARRRLAS